MPAKARAGTKERSEEILDAAQLVFTAKGYAGATTDEIARIAKASKTTLYGLFGNKESLFRTLLERRLAPPDMGEARLSVDEAPRAVIKRLVVGILRGVTSPEAAALVRIAVSEAVRFPGLKQVMAESLRYGELAAYLRACRAKGLMAFRDADETAAMLVSMAQSDWTVRALYGLLDKVSPKQIDAHAALVADMFLAGVYPKR